MPSTAPFHLEEATIADVHAAIRSGDLTARALCEAYLKRIDDHDRAGAELNAIVAVNDTALDRADELDAAFARTGDLVGPLHGIAVVVKDNVDTQDIDTTCGNEALVGHRPRRDAAAVARLREAGAIILAKTTLPDFATSWFSYSSVSGETRNPYALDHDPGGSSAGTGAAVAANLASVGIGTDCGGSVRLPASFCGLVGVRSTPGVVPRSGSGFLVAFQDTVGPMARTVADAVAVFDVMSGYDPADPYSVAATVGNPPARYADALDDDGLRGARIGLVTNALGGPDERGSDAVDTLVSDAVAAMVAAGADVVEVEIPDLADHLAATSQYVACSRHDIDLYLREHAGLEHLRVADLVAQGRYHRQLDLLEAVVGGPERPEADPDYTARFVAREAFTRTVLDLMARHGLDALTYPTTRVPPPSRAERDAWTVLTFPTNTLIASQALLPSVSVPAGHAPTGLPVGIEIVARPYDEAMTFRLAHAYERATGHRRAPEATAG